MADFVQTMKDWRRMCESCDRNEKIGCLVNGSVCAGFRKMIDEIDLGVVEAKVTAWAAEHPEPVYPTWAEFLHEAFCERYPMPYRGNTAWYAFLRETPIPANIAKKLEIQPKEG